MVKRAVAALLAVLVVVCAANSTAFADWYDDVKSGTTWVEIEGDGFVVDTFCGVEARYNKSDYYYQCNELIMRFYREAYGLEIMAYAVMEMFINGQLVRTAEGPQMMTSGYTFKKTDTAKVGDIIYVSAEMRNSGSDHWAIVKEISGGYITMFEQNVVWEGKAAFNRKIKYPSDSYYIYTPVSTNGGPAPVLGNAEQDPEPTATEVASTVENVSETAVSESGTSTESTAENQESSSAVAETTSPVTTEEVTTKPTTTQRPTTTRRVTTTRKPTTTRKVTTTRKPTTTRPTTTAPVTTTELSTIAESTTVWYYTYNYTSEQTEMDFYSSSEYTETDEEKNKATLPLAIICGVIACGVAALVVILIKKKQH